MAQDTPSPPFVHIATKIAGRSCRNLRMSLVPKNATTFPPTELPPSPPSSFGFPTTISPSSTSSTGGNPPAAATDTDDVEVDVAAVSKPSSIQPPPQVDPTSSIPDASQAPPATIAAISTATTPPSPPPPSPAASPAEASFPPSTGPTPTQMPPPSAPPPIISNLIPPPIVPPPLNSFDPPSPPIVTPPSNSPDPPPAPTVTLPSNSTNSSSLETSSAKNPYPVSTSSLLAPPPPNGTGTSGNQVPSVAASVNAKSSSTAPLIGGIIGGCSGLLVIVILVFLYIRWQRRNNGNGDGVAPGGMESKYYQFDPDIGPTPRFARIRAAIDWKLDRALDSLSAAKLRVFPKEQSTSANAARRASQFPELYQRNTGPPQTSGIAKNRVAGWHWGFGKRSKDPVGTPGPRARSVSAGPPVIPPLLPHSRINSTASVDFSQLLQMEERERLIQQGLDRVGREPARSSSGMDIPPGSARQSYSSQPGLATPQRASINPFSHRRSSTVGVASWYERPERERDRRFRSDPFDLESFSGFKLGESLELDGQPSILRQSDNTNYSVRPDTAASSRARESRTSQYSMESYYQERTRDSTWTDDRPWSLSSAHLGPVPGMAL